MNLGFTAKILKLNINLRSGSMHLHNGQKKHVKVGTPSCQCWLVFCDYKGLVHHECAHEAHHSLFTNKDENFFFR